MPETRVNIARNGEAKHQIQAAVYIPRKGSVSEEVDAEYRASTGIILTHPHPKLGGDMNNNVVVALAKALARQGYTVLRFDFYPRSWSGSGDRDDVRSVVDYMKYQLDLSRICIVGYSFGSVVGGNVAATDDDVDAFVMISPPWGYTSNILFYYLYQETADSEKPKLLLCGDRDNFTGKGRFESKCEGMCEPKEIEVFPRCDHFWFGKEPLLVERISQWLADLEEHFLQHDSWK